jgi:hypothetical protein
MGWRAITDTLPQSETLSRVSHLAERVYFRMLSQSDTWGRLSGSPAKIKAKCLPTLDVTTEDLVDALEELVNVGRIIVYAQANGELACQLVEFDEHQPKALLGRRGSSRFGDPPDEAITDACRRMQAARMGGHDRARLVVRAHDLSRLRTTREDQTETENRDREEGSPTASTEGPGELPFSKNEDDLEELVASLKGSDEHTLAVLRSVLHGQPEVVLARALESLEARRRDRTKQPLVSEARYLVSICQRLREERAA